MSPVVFFYGATKISADGGISLATAMSCCVFYVIAATSAIEEHGSTSRTIKKLYSTSKLVEFDKKHGGVFKTYVENPDPDIPYSNNKVSSQFHYTHTEKVGFVFALCTILLIAVGGAVFASQSDIDLTCGSIQVACGHVPDDGSKIFIDVDASFSLRQGCAMTNSVSEVVDLCAQAVLNVEASEPESLSWDDFSDEGELDLELDAIAELQSEADAASSEQLSGGNMQR